MKDKLWVEKYRPNTLAEYVFVNQDQKEQVEKWVDEKIIPHLLLSGEPGTGKTSLGYVLIKELNIDPYDVLYINASRESGVNIVRDKINLFCQTVPFGSYKIVFLDEVDGTSPDFQKALRSDMEMYASTVRFILTCNYEHKIIPALRESRCYKMHISRPDLTDFTARVATTLINEQIEFDLDILDVYVRASYPDLRKCLNQVQHNIKENKLKTPQSTGQNEDELLMSAVELFKGGKILEGRQQLMQYIGLYPTRIEDVCRWAYDNIDLWGKSQEKKDASIVVIRNTLASLPLVGIPEISLAAMLVELTT